MSTIGISPATRPASAPALARVLLGATRSKVLALLYCHAERGFHLREISRQACAALGAVQRELRRLADAGFITRTRQGNQVHFQANPVCPVFPELRMLMVKTAGVAEIVEQALHPLRMHISTAFIFGSHATGEITDKSDVDLLVVGNVDEIGLHRAIARAEQRINRAVNYTLLTPREATLRAKEKTGFLARVLAGSKILIIGDAHEIR
ncbi:MAG: nucleotidyltransferase domain-containing protein [bacterium]|nr:nucleotidyltransferase domain-containing protein [bacterium]